MKLSFADGLLHVAGTSGPLIERGYARVVLSDGSELTTHAGDWSCDDAGFRLRVSGHVTLEWVGRQAADSLTLTLNIENPHPYDLAIERLDVLVTELENVDFASLEVLQAGYQSWSFATPLSPLAQNTRPQPPPITGPGVASSDGVFRSYGVTLLKQRGEWPVLYGFTTAAHFHGTLTLGARFTGAQLLASCAGEGRRLRAGAIRSSEPLRVASGPDAQNLLDAYACEVSRGMAARHSHAAPTGWCSWYYYFTEVTEADIVNNLAVLDACRARLPVAVVQLDDGYQVAIGDWLEVNAKFPSGLKALAERIHRHGYAAGLWLAPFFVSEASETYRLHPDWVIRDQAGLPVNAIQNWGTRNFGLDTTHPEVIAHLRRVLGVIVDDWGFDYLKIDFVYGAALSGVRYDPDATSVEAYRRGLALVREVARERFVLACGAPWLPSVGFVDGMRVGPDTAPFWASPDPLGSAPALWNAIRTTLARHWQHGRLWQNDPDCLIVRRENSELTEAEVRSWASVVALSGGMVLLSDALDKLEPERLAIIPRLLPPLGRAAAPLGPFVAGVPTRQWLPLMRAGEPFCLLALFNWHDTARALSFEPQLWPQIPPRYHLYDLWSGAYAGALTGEFALGEVAAHDVRLLAISEDKGRPQLVGSSLTLWAGALEVQASEWDPIHLTLTLALACPGTHTGELVVAAGAGYRLLRAVKPSEQANGVIRLPLTLVESTRLTLEFERTPPEYRAP